jgi:GDP-L-fucose synthase
MKLVITGGDGFLGHHVVDAFQQTGCDIFIIKHEYYDLLDIRQVKKIYKEMKPDVVIHLAARVGGIQYNKLNPGKLFYENLQMGMNIIHEAAIYGKLQKMVCVGTICSYPITPPIPFKEEDLWNGYPEPTNASYGIAKKALLTMCQAYREQYDLNCIYLLPVNLFGPEDHFGDEVGHVIPMLIKRFLVAVQQSAPEVIVWGSGNATREFLYAGDCAKVILKATQVYNGKEPMNVGSGSEISIKDLSSLIAKIVGYKGKIVFDLSKPDGQPRRVLDVSRIERELGFQKTSILSLEEGLRRTISWYVSKGGQDDIDNNPIV